MYVCVMDLWDYLLWVFFSFVFFWILINSSLPSLDIYPDSNLILIALYSHLRSSHT